MAYDDELSSKEIDMFVEAAQASNDHAVENMNNNDPDYVGTRFMELHAHGKKLLRNPDGVPLRALEATDYKSSKHPIFPGTDGQGILVDLENTKTWATETYLVETDGFNGVKVTRSK